MTRDEIPLEAQTTMTEEEIQQLLRDSERPSWPYWLLVVFVFVFMAFASFGQGLLMGARG